MKKINIAIDGYAGCGKSSTAKEVAKRLNYIYVDTGAMYRAVTFYLLGTNVDLNNESQVEALLPYIHLSFEKNPESGKLEVYLNNEPVEPFIRSMEVSNKVSEVSALGVVRRFLVEQQKKIAQGGGIVMDGRDIGTVVLPDAELKIFMFSDIEVRAKRRQTELLEKGEFVSLEEIIENLQKRDLIDTTRAESPLRKAEDAIELDTSCTTMEEQIEQILRWAEERINELQPL
ncbi:MAG: (d)CMP kinase [Cytophagales bacterium]|nr:(d)CMP kinase [Cytophagales bacterium]MDW8383336.1 (d)CMP kinase [Flammeovirgaceae bacterium]